MSALEKHGRIAFITTPDFRESRKVEADRFVYRHMYSLCRFFTVITTGRTYEELLCKILGRDLDETTEEHSRLIAEDTGFEIKTTQNLDQWKQTIRASLKPTVSSYPGMIHVAYELVEGRLDALIHLTDWVDKSAKPDSAVLAREANVHNVPAATDVETATAFIESWHSSLAKTSKRSKLFRDRQEPEDPPLRGIEESDKVIAMVAHNNMKLEICRFAVEHAAQIFRRYKYVLATGTTGSWLRKFMEASGRGQGEIDRIRCCNSGPLGGDLQIAYAVVRGLCHEIVFFQDPSVSHPHDSDIRLFEQAVLSEKVKVKLATNPDSARLLIGV